MEQRSDRHTTEGHHGGQEDLKVQTPRGDGRAGLGAQKELPNPPSRASVQLWDGMDCFYSGMGECPV